MVRGVPEQSAAGEPGALLPNLKNGQTSKYYASESVNSDYNAFANRKTLNMWTGQNATGSAAFDNPS